MAEKAGKDKAESAPADGSGGKPKKGKMKTLIVIGFLMAVEAGAIVFAMKMMGGGPAPSEAAVTEPGEHGESAGQGGGGEHGAASGHEVPASAPGTQIELPVTELDAYNNISGRIMVYHIQICAVVGKEKEKTFNDLVKTKENTIRDRIQTILRSADPKHLGEPGLETLKRQILFELQKVLGTEAGIQELLIPKLHQSRVAV